MTMTVLFDPVLFVVRWICVNFLHCCRYIAALSMERTMSSSASYYSSILSDVGTLVLFLANNNLPRSGEHPSDHRELELQGRTD